MYKLDLIKLSIIVEITYVYFWKILFFDNLPIYI